MRSHISSFGRTLELSVHSICGAQHCGGGGVPNVRDRSRWGVGRPTTIGMQGAASLAPCDVGCRVEWELPSCYTRGYCLAKARGNSHNALS